MVIPELARSRRTTLPAMTSPVAGETMTSTLGGPELVGGPGSTTVVGTVRAPPPPSSPPPPPPPPEHAAVTPARTKRVPTRAAAEADGRDLMAAEASPGPGG